jgi:hypothetical protein
MRHETEQDAGPRRRPSPAINQRVFEGGDGLLWIARRPEDLASRQLANTARERVFERDALAAANGTCERFVAVTTTVG